MGFTTIKQCSKRVKKRQALYPTGQTHKWALFHFYDHFNITLSITNQTSFDSSALKVIGNGAIHGAC